MVGQNGDTLSLEDTPAARTQPRSGALTLVLEYQRPLAGSLSFSLDGVDEVIIGRGMERALERSTHASLRLLTVRVPDRFMSHEHVRLVRFSGQWRAVDLGSKNGILVNGNACQRATVDDGAVLEVGQTAFVLRHGAAALVEPQLGITTFQHDFALQLSELARLSTNSVPILLLGETGSGKDVVASAVHRASERKGALVAVNCAALPASLLEATLFGHRKGAFSGADTDRPGLVRSAEGGSLFLDEIGDLPQPAQAALLRVLDERAVMAVGDARPLPVDFRLIAATNRDLKKMVDAGAFRADLYARLCGLVVTLPPLRARREDLGTLVASILARSPGTERLTLSKHAARALLLHDFPHNVRQLAHCLTTALNLSQNGVIDLPQLKLEAASTAHATEPATECQEDSEDKRRIVTLLEQHHGNVAQVARELDKAPTQVYRWMQRYGIRPGKFRD